MDLLSWHMKNMAPVSGTYPNEYTRLYAAQLLEQQEDFQLDAITGATSSGYNFEKMAAAVIEQAKKGDPTTIQVKSDVKEP